MPIEIIASWTTISEEEIITRTAEFVISDGVTEYHWAAGALPIEGDLQTILDARFDDLWAEASAAAQPVEPEHQAVIDFSKLPGWADWTGEEAASYIHDQVLSGWTTQQVADWVNSTVVDLATAKTALIIAGQELVELRDICENMGRSIAYLRDIVIKQYE